jgi:hypothetical protein
MTERQTQWTLGVVVAVLVALALTLTIRSAIDEPKVFSPPEWQNLTPEQREQKLDDEERKRRASGRGPSRRQLPEDKVEKKRDCSIIGANVWVYGG